MKLTRKRLLQRSRRLSALFQPQLSQFAQRSLQSPRYLLPFLPQLVQLSPLLSQSKRLPGPYSPQFLRFPLLSGPLELVSLLQQRL